MSLILRVLALAAFIVAVVLAWVVDAPDTLDILTALSLGLAFWVSATLAGEAVPR